MRPLALILLFAGLASAQTPPPPNPAADKALERIKAAGFEVKRNPVFDAISKREASGIPFAEAVQPFTGCVPFGAKQHQAKAVLEDQKLTAIVAQAKADGVECTFARNPVFDAITHAEADGAKTFEEAAAGFLGAIPPKVARAARTSANLPKATEAKWDGRTSGHVPPIRNQANCGSCWAFAGISGVESSYLAQAGGDPSSVDFSEQCILDCEGSNGGCSGDWPETVLAFGKTKGIATEKDSPYKARRGSCPPSLKFPVKLADYGYIGSSDSVADTQAIKDAIKAYGNAIVAVAVDNRFSAYSSGVFSGSARSINHAVNLVGWDDEQGCWIMRNTWGTTWGEQGYMRIKYGANSIGYGAMWAKVLVENPTPPAPPGPTPPMPGTGFTGVMTYKDGSLVSVTHGQRIDVEGDLQAAGVSPATIVAVMKLVQSIRKKAPRDVIMNDIVALIATLALSEPKVQAPPPCCGQVGAPAEMPLALAP
jgi:C1A family cysteine protease